MRRVVTALVLVVGASMLAACTSGGATGGTTGTGTPTQPTAPVASSSGSVPSTNTDILSPTQPVKEGEMFPTDANAVPAAILANLQAKKPMIVYYYDPTTNVAANEAKELDAALKKFKGEIELMSFDYTLGLPSGTATASGDPEVDKGELLSGVLGIKTTPYLVFVDSSGRVTYRFAGYVDRMLIRREVLRAVD